VCPNPKIVTIYLEALENILKVGQAEKEQGNTRDNVYVHMIDDARSMSDMHFLIFHIF